HLNITFMRQAVNTFFRKSFCCYFYKRPKEIIAHDLSDEKIIFESLNRKTCSHLAACFYDSSAS
ncbi:hypothetical protein, partial [Bacillus paralicheniformis]|uniref:hypothetical protein n=1 Tax=Bacillus paralicheniformis TaxID=1648923 RepID=UPI00196AD06F